MTGTTATLAVWDAIGAAIQGAADPPDSLNPDRFYRDGEVPRDAGLGYYLFGQDFESEAGYVNQVGQVSRYTIHCWARTPTEASRLYAWLKGVLHDQRLPLTGNQMIGIRMSKGGHVADPDGGAYQIPTALDVETLAV